MGETIELVETRVVPVDLPRNMSILSKSGELLEASVEAWMFGILGVLTEQQQSRIFDIVRRVKIEEAVAAPNQIIHAPSVGSTERFGAP